jgi:hypothetical protein
MTGRKQTSRDHQQSNKIEMRPDGWERFRRAVGAAAKSGPKHRTAKDQPSKKRLGAARSRQNDRSK